MVSGDSVGEAPLVLRKHPAIIHHSIDLTLIERKLINALLVNAAEDFASETALHRIRIQDLKAHMGFNSKNDVPIKDALTKLNGTQFHWNILGRDRKNQWGVSTFLASAVIEGGYCEYSFSAHLKSLVAKPSLYAKLHIRLQAQFKSKFTLILWEILAERRGTGHSNEWISLEQYKKMLGVSDDPSYSEMKYLARDIIKVPLRELNQQMDYTVEVQYRRDKHRKVEALLFIVKPKAGTGALENNAKDTPTAKRLRTFGLSDGQVQHTLAQYDPAHIHNSLDAVEKMVNLGKVVSVAPYTLKVLKANVGAQKPLFEVRKDGQVKKKADAMQKEKTIQENESIKWRFIEREVNIYLDRIGAEMQKETENAFWADKGGNGPNGMVLARREQGIRSSVVWPSFVNWLFNRIHEIFPEMEFEQFKRG